MKSGFDFTKRFACGLLLGVILTTLPPAQASSISPAYDHRESIDPILVYSTYLGGIGTDTGKAVAVDPEGNVYITGTTDSAFFPVARPAQNAYAGQRDVFVAKIDPAGSIVYITYLGGSGHDGGNAIAVDRMGQVYVTGKTASDNFPIVVPFQPAYAGGVSDVFVAKLDASGSVLRYSTYIGGIGGEEGYALSVDEEGQVTLAGETSSTNFPTAHPIQATRSGILDAFVAKVNATGSALIYSTYLGGTSSEIGYGMATDADGNAYVTGLTRSADFPTVSPMQASLSGGMDAFVAKLNRSGSALMYATYLGGSDDELRSAIAVDQAGNAYVTGATRSSDFPLSAPLQAVYAGGAYDIFVTKLSPLGTSLLYSTYLGGSGDDWGNAIAVDRKGSAYLTGFTHSTNFPLVKPLQAVYGGGSHAFVTEISGTTLHFSTYLGGRGYGPGQAIAVDETGAIIIAGMTSSTDFPVVRPLQPEYAGGLYDIFIAKVGQTPLPVSTPIPPSPIPEPLPQTPPPSPALSPAPRPTITPQPTPNPVPPRQRLPAPGLRRKSRLTCDGLPVTILGTAGNDALHGTSGSDVIHGLGGNDTLRGLGGNDVICGGEGEDRLYGEEGQDRLDGGGGRDLCDGGPDRDTANQCERSSGIP